jgi:hypothetical protein
MDILNIKNRFDSELIQISDEQQLENLRVKYLGRKGLLNLYFQSLTKTDKSKTAGN